MMEFLAVSQLSMGTGCSAWARVAQHGHGLLSMGTGCSAWARVARHGHGLLGMGTGYTACACLVHIVGGLQRVN